jgi:dihydropteroate synthase
MRASTAEAAIGMGATYVNDVSGGLADPAMGKLLSRNPGIQYILMHWRGHSKNMTDAASYENVVREVKEELDDRVIEMLKAGVNEEQIILDPGIGFAKLPIHNWDVLRGIDRISMLGYPVLVGASRKRFLGELLGANSPDDRESASIALTTILAERKIWGVRTHSVKPHRDAIAVVEEMNK